MLRRDTYARELFFRFRGFDAEPSAVSLAAIGSSNAAAVMSV